MKHLNLFVACLFLGAIGVVSGVKAIDLRHAELPDIDTEGACAIHLLSGAQSKFKTGEGVLGADKAKLGDYMYYDDAEGGGVFVSSGFSCLIKREDYSQLLSNNLTDLVQEKKVLMGGRPGDFVLTKLGNRFALVTFGEMTYKGAEIHWILTDLEPVSLSKEEVEALYALNAPREPSPAQSGAASLPPLSNGEASLFLFDRGEVIIQHGVDLDQPLFRVVKELSGVAYLAYHVMPDKSGILLFPDSRSAILGRGALSDFALQDLSSVDLTRAFSYGSEDLVSGVVMLIKTVKSKYALIRVELADETGFQFQWVFLADGSAFFPEVAPLKKAVPTVMTDEKREIQKQLERVINSSVRERDARVKGAFEKVLKEGADVNALLKEGGDLPLPKAVSYGSIYMVELLIDAGAEINGTAALHRAAFEGKEDLLRLLIEKGGDISQLDSRGRTPFEAVKTAYRPDPEILRLVQGRASLDIYSACMVGDGRRVKELIDSGIDVNCRDNTKGYAPLHYAAEMGYASVCQLLINAGAEASINKTYKRITPMLLAIRGGHEDVVGVLLDNVGIIEKGKAYRDAARQDEETIALMILKSVENAGEMYEAFPEFESMLSAGSRDSVYWELKERGVVLPVWAAAVAGDVEAISEAVAAGIDLDQTGSPWDETALQRAVFVSKYNSVNILLEADASPNVHAPKRNKITPLLDAVNKGDERIVGLLLVHGADVSLSDNSGRTPLYRAVRSGRTEIVKLLLEAGADQREIPALRSSDGTEKVLADLTEKKQIKRMLKKYD